MFSFWQIYELTSAHTSWICNVYFSCDFRMLRAPSRPAEDNRQESTGIKRMPAIMGLGGEREREGGWRGAERMGWREKLGGGWWTGWLRQSGGCARSKRRCSSKLNCIHFALLKCSCEWSTCTRSAENELSYMLPKCLKWALAWGSQLKQMRRNEKRIFLGGIVL